MRTEDDLRAMVGALRATASEVASSAERRGGSIGAAAAQLSEIDARVCALKWALGEERIYPADRPAPAIAAMHAGAEARILNDDMYARAFA